MSEPSQAVFLSYASQDAEAAKRICDALRAAGVEVWFDQNELVGGDAWDTKIRKQIGSCALFVPIISANTQARAEGYFRLEWRLADRRTELMGKSRTFLLPVCIDSTRDSQADVPDSFVAVQWTRLPGGETTPAFVARVTRLLEGGDGRSADSTPTRPVAPVSSKAAPRPKWPWVAAAVCGVAGIAAFLLRETWSKPPAPAVPAAGAAAPSTVVATEAQRLVQQAQDLLARSDELNRQNFQLAEELVTRALALEPANPDAVLLSAQISCNYIWYLFDNSAARREQLQQQTARAVALRPDSAAARLNQVNAQATLFFNYSEAPVAFDLEKEARALVALEPRNWRTHRALSSVLRTLNRREEAVAVMRDAYEVSNGNPDAAADLINVLVRGGRYPEAEVIRAQAMAGVPVARLLCWDVMLKLRWHGDPAAAIEAVKAWPGWLVQEDRGMFHRWQAYHWGRRPVEAERLARMAVRDMVKDFSFYGPTAVLRAWSNEMAGNREAALADWRVALEKAERELRAEADNEPGLYWKAWALARLGRMDEAKAIVALLAQRGRGSQFAKVTYLEALQVAVGDKASAFAGLRSRLKSPEDSLGVTRAMLELDPAYDSVRNDPEFQAILRDAPARTRDTSPTAAPLRADDKSVAVLAFANLSDDKANEYFSDGISEELLNVLAKVPGLTVRGRSSGFYFKGAQVTAAEIGRQLAVNYLVQGSVRRAGERVRISAQLIRAASDEVLWSSGAMDRDLKDILAVQDEIARVIVQNLALKLSDDRTKAKVVDPEAHRLVLEGRHYLSLRGEANFERSDEAFRKAVATAPDMAQAHAGWAELVAQRGRYTQMAGLAAPGSQLAEVERHAAQALRLDPSLSEPHAALAVALVDAGRLQEADVETERGITANPNYGSHYLWRAHLHAARGRLGAAISDLQRATELDPLAFVHLYIYGAYLGYADRWAEALPVLDRGASLRAERFLPLEGDRALARYQLGRRAEAMTLARSILADPEMLTLAWWSIGESLWILRQGGAAEEAARHGEEVLAKLAPDNYLRGYVLCCLGRFEEGLPLLRNIPTIARNRFYFVPMFDPVRDTPAFKRLISDMNVEKEYELARADLARMKKGRSSE